LENKVTGRESERACRQNEMIGGKPPVVKWLDSESCLKRLTMKCIVFSFVSKINLISLSLLNMATVLRTILTDSHLCSGTSQLQWTHTQFAVAYACLMRIDVLCSHISSSFCNLLGHT
jgi:hypothetical protein